MKYCRVFNGLLITKCCCCSAAGVYGDPNLHSFYDDPSPYDRYKDHYHKEYKDYFEQHKEMKDYRDGKCHILQ